MLVIAVMMLRTLSLGVIKLHRFWGAREKNEKSTSRVARGAGLAVNTKAASGAVLLPLIFVCGRQSTESLR